MSNKKVWLFRDEHGYYNLSTVKPVLMKYEECVDKGDEYWFKVNYDYVAFISKEKARLMAGRSLRELECIELSLAL